MGRSFTIFFSGNSAPARRLLLGISILSLQSYTHEPAKVKRPSSITVEEFFRLNEKALKLRLVGSNAGFKSNISPRPQ